LKELQMNALARLFPPALLALNGLIYLGVGWLFISDVAGWFETVGVSLRSDTGYTELRSVYGGFMLAFGAFLLVCALRRPYASAGVLLLVFTYAGLVAARSWGVLVEQAYNATILQIYISEWLALVLSIAAWFCLKRGD
jgi:hypothetical protein